MLDYYVKILGIDLTTLFYKDYANFYKNILNVIYGPATQKMQLKVWRLHRHFTIPAALSMYYVRLSFVHHTPCNGLPR